MEEEVAQNLNVEQVVQDVLGTIEREREREIVSRRFGLFDRRETLEQIGELLGITRERVRQLEKAVITKLKAAAKNDLPHIKEIETTLGEYLKNYGNVAKVSDVASQLVPNVTKVDQSRITFLASLSPGIAVIDDNDHFFHAIGLAEKHTEKAIRNHVGQIIEAIKEIGKPTDIETVADKLSGLDAKHVEALAGISKISPACI